MEPVNNPILTTTPRQVTDEELIKYFYMEVMFKDPIDKELKACFREMDSHENMTYHPETIRHAGISAMIRTFVLGVRYGMTQPQLREAYTDKPPKKTTAL